MENSMIMKQGVASLKGKWGLAITGNIVGLIISMVLGISSVFIIGVEWAGNLATLVVAPPLAIGICIFSLNIIRDNNPKVDDLNLLQKKANRSPQIHQTVQLQNKNA